MIALLLATAAVSGSIFTVMAVDREVPDGVLMETVVPEGEWAVPWSGRMEPPGVEQGRRLLALRRAVAGVAGILAVLGLLSAGALWRQRLRLRRGEDFTAWAVGARPAHFVARLSGEGWPWVAGALVSAGVGATAVFRLVVETFPGSVQLPADWAAVLLVLTGLATVVVHRESRAGQDAGGRGNRLLWRGASSPVTVAALGFGALSGVGLLLAHGPHSPAAGGSGEGAVVPPALVTASLTGLASPARTSLLDTWREALRDQGGSAGFASAGTVRGTGHRDRVWVDCGRCSQGGLPLPIRTVAAEVHAVAPDTFTRLGLVVREGRDFSSSDSAYGAAVVSRSLAARHFQGGRAVGRRLRVGESDWIMVVGIVDDRPDLHDHTEYNVYLPLGWAAPSELEVLPDQGSVAATLASVPGAIRITGEGPGSAAFGALPWFRTFMAALGAVALLLVAAGTRAATAAATRKEAFELALRRALGADRGAILWFRARRALGRLSTALLLGACISLVLGNALNEAFGGIPLLDLRIWGLAGATVVLAWAAGSVPASRRARRDAPARMLAAGE